MTEPQQIEWTCGLCGEVVIFAPEYGSSLSHEMHVELSRLRAELVDLNGRYDRALDQLAAHNAPIETLRDALDRARAALEAWDKWAEENQEHINACITVAAVHGNPYTGAAWPRDTARAVLDEHRGAEQ